MHVHVTEVRAHCRQQDVRVVGRIPYDRSVVAALMRKNTVFEHPCGEVSEEIKRMWQAVRTMLDESGAKENEDTRS